MLVASCELQVRVTYLLLVTSCELRVASRESRRHARAMGRDRYEARLAAEPGVHAHAPDLGGARDEGLNAPRLAARRTGERDGGRRTATDGKRGERREEARRLARQARVTQQTLVISRKCFRARSVWCIAHRAARIAYRVPREPRAPEPQRPHESAPRAAPSPGADVRQGGRVTRRVDVATRKPPGPGAVCALS